jgi:hypothetical protein
MARQAGAAENVFNAVGTAGHHEVGGGNQRQKAHLARRDWRPGHHCESNNPGRFIREAKKSVLAEGIDIFAQVRRAGS